MDLIKLGDENLDELLQAQAHVWNHTLRLISSMSLKCAVQLEIPDIIHNHGQPMTISELALALPIHPSKIHCLYRLVRILVYSGFFAEKKTDQSDRKWLCPHPCFSSSPQGQSLKCKTFVTCSA